MDLSALQITWAGVRCPLKWARAAMLRRWFGLTRVMVFRDGEALEGVFPIRKFFSSPNRETYALWYAGSGMWASMVRYGCGPKEIILPDPRNEALLAQLDASFTDKVSLGSAETIRKTTGVALGLEHPAAVYWYDGWPGVALTFQDPEQNNGTLNLEPIPKHLGIFRRPIMRFTRGKNPEAFDAYWRLYQQIREDSELQELPALESPGDPKGPKP